MYFCLQFPRNGSIGQSTIQSWWGNTVNINTADYGRNGGGSALTAVEALQRAGAEVVAVAIIVDRATGAKERIEESAGVPCLYAFGKDELGLD